jgi:hypothetical protein
MAGVAFHGNPNMPMSLLLETKIKCRQQTWKFALLN